MRKKPLISIAFIPDGNRRYAKKYGLTLYEAYKAGINKAIEVVEWMKKEKTVRVGSFYAFSLKNLDRSPAERKILARSFEEEFAKLEKEGFFDSLKARIKFIGCRGVLGKNIAKLIDNIETSTSHYNRFLINIAFGYDGRREIVDACKRIALAYKKGMININDLNEDMFKKFLYNEFQEPDLVIRTSGEQRLSGFLTYYTSYSELYFCNKLWPEFEKEDFEKAVQTYYSRERRFGR